MLNHITIAGRLTRDPDLRYTQSQVAVCSYSVAVERDYAGQGQQRETDFFDCVAWRQGGEFVSKYFRKGDMIIVEGRMQARDWTDNQGNKRRSWEIQVDRNYFGGSKRDDGGQSSGGQYGGNQYGGNQGGGYYPQQGQYGAQPAPPQQQSYQTAPPQYGAPPQQAAYQPPQQQQFQELDDDDGDLPF